MAATAANKRWFALGIVLLWGAADWPMHRGGPLLQGRADEAAPAQAALGYK